MYSSINEFVAVDYRKKKKEIFGRGSINRIIGALTGLLYNLLKLYIILATLGRIQINIDISKREAPP